MADLEINYACEGQLDAAIAERLILHSGGTVGIARPAGGKSKLDPFIPKYFSASRHQRMKWLVLRDLDRDEHCAPLLRNRLVTDSDSKFCFRIAVRESESWLMADLQSFARFLRVSEGRIPETPDALDHPKQVVVSLARRSTRRAIKEAIIPSLGSGLPTGPEYAVLMGEFVSQHWDVARAVALRRSPSLVKAATRIAAMIAA